MPKSRPGLRRDVKLSRYLLSALWVALSVVLISPAAGLAAQEDVSQIEVESYREGFGVSAQKAENNLEAQHEGSEVVEQLQSAQGEDYSGVWFDNASGEFVVPLSEPATRASVTDTLQETGLDDSYRTKPVQYSFEELEAAHGRVDKALQELIEEHLVQTSIDPRTNAVVVSEVEALGKREHSQILAAIAAEGQKVEVRQGDVERYGARAFACDATYHVCDKPLRAGVLIDSPDGSVGCTAGFKALGNVYGNRFVLTAGHCSQHSVHWRSRDSENYAHYLGAVEEGTFPGDDWAKIRVNGETASGDNDWWEQGTSWPSRVVYWGGEQNIPIEYESSSYIGETVCHSGIGSGSSCGTVSAIDVTVTYEGAPSPVYHLTQAQLYALPGDSGGPVWSGNTALGLISGGNFATGVDYFVEVIGADQAMGVHVGSAVGAPPAVETGNPPVEIQSSQATVGGKVDPNGLSTSYHFEYGTTTSFGSSTGEVGAGSAWGAGAASGTLANLQPVTDYWYRLVASNSAGTGYGAPVLFTTLAAPPSASVEAASSRTQTAATLNGAVNPNGAETTYQFEYGTSTSYGSKVPVPAKNIGKGKSAVSVSQSIGGLQPATVYHYRIAATNEKGTTYSSDRTFKTMLSSLPAFVEAFGSYGSGAGEFSSPEGIAIDASDNIYVAQGESTHPVQKFNAKGEYLGYLGAKANGNLGSVTGASSLAFDSKGNLWVADSSRAGLFKFNSAGEFISSFGGEVGSSNGQFQPLIGVSIDSKDNLWVVDSGNNRVQEFNAKGEYLRQFGSEGSGNGKFESPLTIGVDAEDHVWVGDWTGRVQRFSSEGSYLGQLSEGGFEEAPGAIVPDAGGDLWIAGVNDPHVKAFSSAGEYLGQLGGAEAPYQPQGLAFDSEGSLRLTDAAAKQVQTWAYPAAPEASTGEAEGLQATEATLTGKVKRHGLATTYQFEYGKTTSYGSKAPASAASAGTGVGEVGVSETISGLTENTTYHYRLIATNSVGAATPGEDHALTTPKATTVSTEAPSSVKATQATLRGKINPHGAVTKYRFEYGETTSYGSNLPAEGSFIPAEDAEMQISDVLTGLSPATTYHYRLVAFNGPATVTYGADQAFTTSGAPTATTYPASLVRSHEATLNAKVNPNGAETTYQFEYGKTTSYGSTAPASPASAGSGTSSVSVDAQIKGLEPNTTYYFRIKATNEGGSEYGMGGNFITTSGAPLVATGAATAASSGGSTLHASVNPDGSATSYQLEYGFTTSYGSKVPASPESVGSGNGDVEVAKAITGLTEGTTYHYRVVATNGVGTTNGADKTFTTPKAGTGSASGVKATEATLNAGVNPKGSPTAYQFEYGTTTSYGSKAPASPEGVGSGTSEVAVNKTISGLTEATTYHYRVVATNETATTFGADKTFTTLKPPKASTEAATDIVATGFAMNAKVNPRGLFTTYEFEYGTTTSYGSNRYSSVGSGSEEISLKWPISKLSENTTYHYRVVAKNADGTTYGVDKTATTATLPKALNGVACPPASQGCIAVGWTREGEAGERQLHVERGIENSWVDLAMEVPAGAQSSELTNVSCPELDHCAVVGNSIVEEESAPLFYWGSGLEGESPEWSAVEVEIPSGATEARLSSVDCRTACMAVGSYRDSEGVLRPLAIGGSGEALSVPLPKGALDGHLNGVSCLSSSECFAAGGADGGLVVEAPLLVKWNGSAWSAAALLDPSHYTELSDVSCVTPVEGNKYCDAISEGGSAFLGYGGAWRYDDNFAYASIGPDASVSCLGALSCAAAGSGGPAADSMRAAFRSASILYSLYWGDSWHRHDPPAPGEGIYAGFNDISCAAVEDCTAVGWREDGEPLFPWHWDGSEWSQGGA
jgi:phosphodiesterase/alkaline phosphatase D-like protein